MHNVIILGSGRSGTSMVAGTLAHAGYFMGENLHPARNANPKGFFEDVDVNAINEAILAEIVPGPPSYPGPTWLRRWLRRIFHPGQPGHGQRWLARIPPGNHIPAPPGIEARIRRLTERQPFCFKDPRFCYTLPIWRPWLAETRFICVFRHPAASAASMLTETQHAPKLAGLKMNYANCLQVWYLMYRHVLDLHRQTGEWLFIHYEQALTAPGLERIATFLEADVDGGFPDPGLQRSRANQAPLPPEIAATYQELTLLAQNSLQDERQETFER
jgi:hypothetical protein